MHCRRRFQFSLRVFLVAITLFAIRLGWNAERARKQRDAVQAIEAIGGVVQYDWQGDVGTWAKSPESWGKWGHVPPQRFVPDDAKPATAQWLRLLFGNIETVQSVIFRTRQAAYSRQTVYSKSGARELWDVSWPKEPGAALSRDIDAVSPKLHGLPQLRAIYLQGNAETISKETENRLRVQFPACRIVREPVITAAP